MNYLLILCLFAITTLCAVDSYSTYIILKSGGKEINPFMNWMINFTSLGFALFVPKLICLSLLIHGIFGAIKKPLKPYKMKIILGAMLVLVGFYALVVYALNTPYLMAKSV